MISETTRLEAAAGVMLVVLFTAMLTSETDPEKVTPCSITVLLPGGTGTETCHVLASIHVTGRKEAFPFTRMPWMSTHPLPESVAVLPLTVNGPAVVRLKVTGGTAVL